MSTPSTPVTPHFAAGDPKGVSLAVVGRARCIAGRAALTVEVKNLEAVSLDFTTQSPVGREKVWNLAAGRTSTQTFATKATALRGGIGSVLVDKVVKGKKVKTTYQVAYAGVDCAV